MSEIKGVSGCMVLFDDGKRNFDDVLAFNAKNKTNFQAVKVDEDDGVTVQDVNYALNALLPESCKN